MKRLVRLVSGGIGGLALYNAGRVRIIRRRAQAMRVQLDHDTLVGEGLGDPLLLVVLGDSSANGYGLDDASKALPFQVATRLSKATGRRVDVRCFAHEGSQARNVLDEQVPLVPTLRPDVIVVVVGVNEAIARGPLPDVRADTRALLIRLREVAPGSELIFAICPDISRAPGLPSPLSYAIGARCRRVARIQREVTADLGVAIADFPRRAEAHEYCPDRFHPGDVLHAQSAALIVAALPALPALVGGAA